MLPLPGHLRLEIGAGLLGLSQRAADLRHAAADTTDPTRHTALTAEALVVETLVTALDAYIARFADATADTERPAAPAPPPARDTERTEKFPSAAPAVGTSEGGSPTAT